MVKIKAVFNVGRKKGDNKNTRNRWINAAIDTMYPRTTNKFNFSTYFETTIRLAELDFAVKINIIA